ncbi:hypothetical protein OIU77_011975 [Salix suchowensis]|uniref:MATE efflux family protein n=1 Tax=Salix suchowensis TaxID=1278906 RepID=A0ABQ9A277_9ROSI|nr:hypothetical protein OIU77_011975 [Salix suchowensis]
MEESLLPRERDEKKQGIAGPNSNTGRVHSGSEKTWLRRRTHGGRDSHAELLASYINHDVWSPWRACPLKYCHGYISFKRHRFQSYESTRQPSLFKSVRTFIEDESKSLNQQVLFFEAECFLIGHNMESIHVTTQLGMASALETLCGQAYGAKQYTKLGTQTYTAIFCLILVCIPISVIWIYMGKILHFIGQDPAISREAGRFTMWLVPALFAYATLQPLTRYFQTQSFIMPMLISSFATLCFPYTSLLGIGIQVWTTKMWELHYAWASHIG